MWGRECKVQKREWGWEESGRMDEGSGSWVRESGSWNKMAGLGERNRASQGNEGEPDQKEIETQGGDKMEGNNGEAEGGVEEG